VVCILPEHLLEDISHRWTPTIPAFENRLHVLKHLGLARQDTRHRIINWGHKRLLSFRVHDRHLILLAKLTLTIDSMRGDRRCLRRLVRGRAFAVVRLRVWRDRVARLVECLWVQVILNFSPIYQSSRLLFLSGPQLNHHVVNGRDTKLVFDWVLIKVRLGWIIWHGLISNGSFCYRWIYTGLLVQNTRYFSV
jgi:hypothetical protein